VIAIASRPHYAAHIAPILDELGNDGEADLAVIVASYADLKTARLRGFSRIVYVEHGAGQSYGGDPESADNPFNPGGRDHDDVGLFLVPNEYAAWRWRTAYPDARVEVVGSPILDGLPAREPGPLTVAISFHWRALIGVPEAGSAMHDYRYALAGLAVEARDRGWRLIGHGHPRRTDLAIRYDRSGIEYVSSFREVCRRADIYACDNSSTLFEFAATGRPVVVLNASAYRRDRDHGLRFWAAAGVGANVDRPEDFSAIVEYALTDPALFREERERALDLVYQPRSGGARLAAEAIRSYLAH
jgi:hypothetical protein